MDIKHDRSYLPEKGVNLFVPLGYAEEDLYQFRFQFEYTEQEKKENLAMAQVLDPQEWAKRCNEKRLARSNEMEPVMAALAKEFVCYQYDKGVPLDYRSKRWDLFFWCNDLYQTTCGDLSGRDFSYFTLTFNEDMTPEQRLDICNRVLGFLIQNFSAMEHLVVYVQYNLRYNGEKLRDDVEKLTPKLLGKCVNYQDNDYFIEKQQEGRLIFRRKYTSNNVVEIPDTIAIEVAVSLGLIK